MQKQPKILNYKNLNIEKYEYLQPHKHSNGYYLSICKYRLTKNQILPFYFETPKLKTTSGIVRIENNYYIDLELPQSGDGGLFYDFLIKNDNNNISICHENSKEWFNQLMPLNIVENYYKTPILLRSNGNLPIIRIRIPSYKGNILTEIFNSRKEKINDISCIQEGDIIVGILEFTGLKFLKQNFTPCYELQKIKIFKDNDYRAIPNGYIFSDASDTIDLETKTININDSIMEQSTENNNEHTITNEYNLASIKRPIPIKSHSSGILVNHDKPLNSVTHINPVNFVNIADTPEPNINKIENISNNITDTPEPNINKIENNNNIKKTKSLYDLIKDTSLDSLYLDDKLFINNNKFITKQNLEQPYNINNNNTVEKSGDGEEAGGGEEASGGGEGGEEADDSEENGGGDGEENGGGGEENGGGGDGEENGNGEENGSDSDEENSICTSDNSDSDNSNSDSDCDIDFDTLNELEVIKFE